MIGVVTKFVNQSTRVKAAVNRAGGKTYPHVAAKIRKSIIAGIKIDKTTLGWITTNRRTKTGKRRRARVYRPSPKGQPVHSHRNKGFVSRGVRFDANKEGAMIGFASSVYGDVMAVHEFGGERHGQDFDARPTVLPGLEDNLEHFHESWRGSIGE